MCNAGSTPSVEASTTEGDPVFFAAIIALPILAGLLAGTFSSSRLPAHVLAAVCLALGLAGAIVTAADDDVTGRAGAVAFGLVCGLVAALLVYGGWQVARAGIRSIRSA
jgi:peptidoglycan/LPS O-acetylase OafA/YrhL